MDEGRTPALDAGECQIIRFLWYSKYNEYI